LLYTGLYFTYYYEMHYERKLKWFFLSVLNKNVDIKFSTHDTAFLKWPSSSGMLKAKRLESYISCCSTWCLYHVPVHCNQDFLLQSNQREHWKQGHLRQVVAIYRFILYSKMTFIIRYAQSQKIGKLYKLLFNLMPFMSIICHCILT
jgi:hypothetical protein